METAGKVSSLSLGLFVFVFLRSLNMPLSRLELNYIFLLNALVFTEESLLVLHIN